MIDITSTSFLINNIDVLNECFMLLGILKFFGRMTRSKPEKVMNMYPIAVKRVFSNLASNDLVIVATTLDTLGYIGETNSGKIALDTFGKYIS